RSRPSSTRLNRPRWPRERGGVAPTSLRRLRRALRARDTDPRARRARARMACRPRRSRLRARPRAVAARLRRAADAPVPGGTDVGPVDSGARTRKEACSEAIRDWVTNVATTHYVIGSAVGPSPYPVVVRDLQRTIGDESRAQLLEAEGRLPDRVIACVGGGSNSIGMFTAFVDDPGVELIGVEAGGEGIESGRHGAP